MKSIKNKYLFFLLRIYKDIFHPTVWPISNDLHSKNLREYYFLFSEDAIINQKGGQKSLFFDEKGIPINPTYIDVKDKAFVYFPITIGQAGLAIFHTYLKSGKEEDKNRFLTIAYWFMDNAIISPDLGARWLTNVLLPQYKNPGPWQSAFSQGRAISVLLRAFQITGEKSFYHTAKDALIPFTKPVREGGVTSYTKWGPFYEEYTAEVPTLVLNGMVFSLCGIYDFVRAFPENQSAKNIFEDGIQTIENILPIFNLGYWSRYNYCQAEWHPDIDPATHTYQKLHITQLDMLYQLTGKQIFKDYSEIFSDQLIMKNIFKMYLSKFKSLKKMGRL